LLKSARNITIDWAGYDPGQAYLDIIDGSGNSRKAAYELTAHLDSDSAESASSNH
jgi:hypothetical protein